MGREQVQSMSDRPTPGEIGGTEEGGRDDIRRSHLRGESESGSPTEKEKLSHRLSALLWDDPKRYLGELWDRFASKSKEEVQNPFTKEMESKKAEILERREKLEDVWKEAQEKYQEGQYADLPSITNGLVESFVTDKGSKIELLPYCMLRRSERDRYQEEEQQYHREQGLESKAQRIGNSGPEYNCFGFTFTGGTGWFESPQDVQRILDDNRYQMTSKPRPGDVIVYREPDTDNIIHTGIVAKADLLPDRTAYALEIESKWGKAGLYRHTPDDMPSTIKYETWEIYHS
ncbi:MAG: hypothetical protein J2P36_24880, partial [Ktedonobacteraceae bacterium]|nr:hypothetical protein [Ktedonobacteraceae bacterium]